MTTATFENTYRNYSFWPLVDIALRAARAIVAAKGDRFARSTGFATEQHAG